MSRPLAQVVPGIYTGMYPREYEQYSAAYGNNLDRVGWKWWDTQTYVSGTTTQLIQWFNTRATVDLSNMEIPFQLAAPKAFLVRAIRFFVKTRPLAVSPAAVSGSALGVIDNVAQLINTGVFTITIGNKTYSLDPLWCLTAGGGAAGLLAMSGGGAAAVDSFDYAQNGIADPRAVNTLPIPIFIPPQLNFSATATWPAALTLQGGNVPLTFLLDGDLLRPVQ